MPKRDDQPEISRRSLARLALSVKLARLSDAAAQLVQTVEDGSNRSGELLDAVRSLVVQADEALGQAAVVERASGASWSDLGEVLGISKQAVQQRYGELEQDWRDALDVSALAGATVLPGESLEAPSAHAERLDAWCEQRGVKRAVQRLPPVSGGLLAASIVEECATLGRLANRVAGEQDPTKQRAFLVRKARVLGRIAAEEPNNAEAQDVAKAARAQLAEVVVRGGEASKGADAKAAVHRRSQN